MKKLTILEQKGNGVIVVCHESLQKIETIGCDIHDELIANNIEHRLGESIRIRFNRIPRKDVLKDIQTIESILERYLGNDYNNEECDVLKGGKIHYNFKSLYR